MGGQIISVTDPDTGEITKTPSDKPAYPQKTGERLRQSQKVHQHLRKIGNRACHKIFTKRITNRLTRIASKHQQGFHQQTAG